MPRDGIAPGDELRHDKILRAPGRNASGAPCESVTLPPAAVTTAWPAATSHSEVGAEAGIDVDRAFGDPAEFDRRAKLRPDGAGPCGDKGFGPGIAMRAADRDRPGFSARRARAGCGSARRAAPRHRRTSAARRRGRRGRARPARARARRRCRAAASLGHQREIDGEFVAAGDEFLGAVERIDQEEAAL